MSHPQAYTFSLHTYANTFQYKIEWVMVSIHAETSNGKYTLLMRIQRKALRVNINELRSSDELLVLFVE